MVGITGRCISTPATHPRRAAEYPEDYDGPGEPWEACMVTRESPGVMIVKYMTQ